MTISVTPGYALYNTQPRKVDWLVEPIIPVQSLFCLNGRGSTFKSWTMTALGVAVAIAHTGRKFMENFRVPVRGPRNSVLFVELEENRDQAAKKYQWILRGLDAKPEEIQDLLMAFVVGQPLRVDKPEDLDALKLAVKQTTPDLVIWDNARRMMRGNMNDDEWPAKLAEIVKDLQTIYPSSHGIVHHWRKKSADAAMNDADQMGRGSEGLRDACDAWLPVELDENGVLTMRQTKNRDGQLVPAFGYRVGIADAERMASLSYYGPAYAKEGPSADKDIMEWMEATPSVPRTRPEIEARFADRHNRKELQRAVDRLAQDQRVYVNRSRRPQRVVLVQYANLIMEP